MKSEGVSHWRESSVSQFSVYYLNVNWLGGKWFAGLDYNKHASICICFEAILETSCGGVGIGE